MDQLSGNAVASDLPTRDSCVFCLTHRAQADSLASSLPFLFVLGAVPSGRIKSLWIVRIFFYAFEDVSS